jgi:hypothetical protein
MQPVFTESEKEKSTKRSVNATIESQKARKASSAVLPAVQASNRSAMRNG